MNNNSFNLFEQRINSLINNSNDYILIITKSFDIKYINNSAKDFFQKYVKNEIREDTNFLSIVFADWVTKLEEDLKNAFNGNKLTEIYPPTVYLPIEAYFEFNYQPIFNENNQVEEVAILIKDITEKINFQKIVVFRNSVNELSGLIAKRFLQNENEQTILRDIFEEIGKLTEVDRIHFFQNRTGIDQTTLMDLKYEWCENGIEPLIDNSQFITKSYDKLYFDNWDKLLSIGNIIVSDLNHSEIKLNSFFKTLNVKSVLVIPVFLWNYWNGYISFQNIKSERTWKDYECEELRKLVDLLSYYFQLKESERKLKDSEERNRGLINAIPDLLFMIKKDGTFSYLKAGLDSDEWETSQFLSDKYLDLPLPFDAKEAVKSLVNLAIETGELQTYEYSIEYKNEKRFFECRITRGGADRAVFIIRDITNTKLTEIELRTAKERAENAIKSKTEFIAKMSHDLRTPLNGILGYAQLLQKTPNLNELQKDGLSVIEKCGIHLLNLINDILDLAKIDSNKLEIKSNEFNLMNFIKNISKIAKLTANEKNINFEMKLTGKIPEYVYGDEKRLYQVLFNLLSNAIKFTIVGTVKFRVYYKDQKASFYIIDTGVGIDEKKLKDIFSPFFKLSESIETFEGSGLGLSISRSLVELMGGELKVRSKLNKGTVFWFTINLPQIVNSNIAEDNFHNIIGYDGDIIKVLIIDDNKIDGDLIKQFLKLLKFEVYLENSCYNLNSIFEKINLDLILISKNNNSLFGENCIRNFEIIKKSGKTKLILISDTYDSINENKIFEYFDDVIYKPFNFREVVFKIGQMLNIKWKYFKKGENVEEQFFPTGEIVTPDIEVLYNLKKIISLGDIDEFQNKLNEISENEPKFYNFVKLLEVFLKNFQLLEIESKLEDFINKKLEY